MSGECEGCGAVGGACYCDPTTGRAGDERGMDACESCWTDSWAPIPDEAGCALAHPHDGEHVVCQYCDAMEQLAATRAALEPFAKVWDECFASVLDIVLDETGWGTLTLGDLRRASDAWHGR